MRSLAVTIAALTLLPAAALASEPGAEPARENAQQAQQLAPLQAREVIERLKTMRAQLLLEQEYNRVLEARLARQELEERLGEAKPKGDKPRADLPRGPLPPPPPRLEDAADALTVKAVTVAPFKEAIVTYKGRVYTVRPGDKLGAIEIKDVNESGVVTGGSGAQKSAVSIGQ